MRISDDHQAHIAATFARMVQQGMSQGMADQAQECTAKMVQLLDQYEAAGLAALGVLLASLPELVRE